MARPLKKANRSKFSELPVYEHNPNGGLRFAHYFNRIGNLSESSFPSLERASVTPYEIAQLAIGIKGAAGGMPDGKDILKAIELLNDCTKQFETRAKRILIKEAESEEKFIDFGEFMEATGIKSKLTIRNAISLIYDVDYANACAESNIRQCIDKDGKSKSIGHNGLIPLSTVIVYLERQGGVL